MEGHIKIYRQLLESSVFASEKRLKVWIWILCKANFRKRHIPIRIGNGEKIITIDRGQLLFGRFKAEEELCIDGSTIYKILKWFEDDGMIKVESNSHYSILTINNYNTFQGGDDEKVTAEEQPCNSQVTAEEQPCNTPKNDNNDNNDKNDKNNTRSRKKNKFTPPSLSEVERYFLDNSFTIELAGKFFKYYEAGNWTFTDKKGNVVSVKNWKQKAQSVWFTDKNKIQLMQKSTLAR